MAFEQKISAKNLLVKYIVLLLQHRYHNKIKNKIVRVTILQTHIEWVQPKVNMERARRLMMLAPASDIYILPEMWTTGFVNDPDLMSLSALTEGASLEWMKQAASEFGGAVSGSLAVRCDDGSFRNRLYFVRPDGVCDYYDKHHLFAYGGEDKHYEPGSKRVIVKFNGKRILLSTCYDLRFPVWLRNRDDYDVILITANWPGSRRNVWNTLLSARAIENQCFVVGANRTGNDPICEYTGDSAIIDAKGKCLASAAGIKEEQFITADLDFESLEKFRSKFPVLNDRDEFELKLKLK